jgi:hypothetical protein
MSTERQLKYKAAYKRQLLCEAAYQCHENAKHDLNASENIS